ncbi:MAG: hypothetical protein MUE78_09280 [Ilumatobacteraceae bacterium]|nr:hypothetical protein [Ilumatobacteraceae bacterium]
MTELAAVVQELVGAAVGVVHRPLPADDPKVRRPDIALARRELGWSPSTPLREGLRRTIDWYRDRGAYAGDRWGSNGA